MEQIAQETKQCPICGEVKPLSGYYKGSHNGCSPYCCECSKRAVRTYRRKPKHEAGELHEQILIDELRKQGIYAAPGKSSEWHHVDVVAWGCVRIEAKTSPLVNGMYSFRFGKGRKVPFWETDLVAFIIAGGDDDGVYLFPSDHPVFFLPSGKPKSNLGYTPRRRNAMYNRFGVALTPDLMRRHKNRWELVEECRKAAGQGQLAFFGKDEYCE